MLAERILFILELIGTIAFAVSGAFVAIKARFDIFGVVVVGCITAVGGGIIRDVLIGTLPPAIFSKLHIILIAVLTSLVVFLIAYAKRKMFDSFREKIEHINNVFDAIGLAAFSVMGTEIAFSQQISDNVFLAIMLGVLSGVGGGVLRDILTETSPYIFKKHVYALASIAGASLYYGMRINTPNNLFPTFFGIVFIVALRLLATKYRWSLPKIHLENKEQELEVSSKEEVDEEYTLVS